MGSDQIKKGAHGDILSKSMSLLDAAVDVARAILFESSKSSFSSLTILAALRIDDKYRHADLEGRLGQHVFQRAIAKLHRQEFVDWLNTPLEAQKMAVGDHLRDVGSIQTGEISPRSFVGCVPDSAEPPERQLFDADLCIILTLLMAERDRKTARVSSISCVWRTIQTIKTDTCHGNLTLRDLARPMGASPNHLGLLFRDQTGLSFHGYLLATRMCIAANLLRLQIMPVKQIAAASGYGDVGSFNRDFRRAFGKSPTAYLRGVEESSRGVVQPG